MNNIGDVMLTVESWSTRRRNCRISNLPIINCTPEGIGFTSGLSDKEHGQS